MIGWHGAVAMTAAALAFCGGTAMAEGTAGLAPKGAVAQGERAAGATDEQGAAPAASMAEPAEPALGEPAADEPVPDAAAESVDGEEPAPAAAPGDGAGEELPEDAAAEPPAEAPAAPSLAFWGRPLPEVLPAMRACLDMTPAPPGMVVQIASMDEQSVNVWTRSSDGRVWDCMAPRHGEGVDMFDRTMPSEGIPGPMFALDRAAFADSACLEVEEAAVAGEPVGWFARDLCSP